MNYEEASGSFSFRKVVSYNYVAIKWAIYGAVCGWARVCLLCEPDEAEASVF